MTTLDTKGLIRLPAIVILGTALQSLPQRDTAELDNTYATQGRGFLWKRMRAMGMIELAPLRFAAFLYGALMSATPSETEAAIEVPVQVGADFTDLAQYLQQQALSWNSISSINSGPGHDDNDPVNFDTGWVNIGKPGVGIPMQEGHGPTLQLYNVGPTLPADVVTHLFVIYEGVYLSD